MTEILKSIDILFYVLIGAAVLLRVLYFDKVRPTMKETFSLTIAAVIVAKTFTEPTLDRIPSEHPELYRDAIVVVYALTGSEILRGILFVVRNPNEALRWIKYIVLRRQ